MKTLLKLALLLSLGLATGWMSAQSLYVYPATVTAPRGSYQTVTAIVSGVNNKTVTWSTTGGTLVGTNPSTANEPATIALYSTTPGTYTVTATTNTGAVAGHSTITIIGSPTPATTHPRLLITASMLAGLQAKATSGNILYSTMKGPALGASAIDYYNQLSAAPASWSWTCTGGSGQPTSGFSAAGLEQQAYLFAFMSLIDPSDPTYNWGCYAHDTWIYFITQVLNGTLAISGNDYGDFSPNLAFTTDWLLAGSTLGETDKVNCRAFLYFMAKLVLNSSYGTDAVVGNYNSSSQFNTGNVFDLTSMRAMGNNYTESKLLILAAAAFTFNDTTLDDPVLTNTCSATRYQVCSDFTAGSLHAYWTYLDGGMLYKAWAHLEDPNVAWQAYQAAYANLPTQPICDTTWGTTYPCFGDGRGGESAEGSWYSYSTYRMSYAMSAIHTAGYDDPILYGPQISLATSSWWDLKYVADAEFLTGMAPLNGGSDGRAPAFGFLSTGDSVGYHRVPNDMWTEAAMMTADTYTGRSDRSSALEWLLMNVAYGGPAGTADSCINYCGFLNNLQNAAGQNLPIDVFISFPSGDPTVSLPADPRPSMPTDLYNGSYNQHVTTRSSWTNPTLFSYYAPQTLNDHEHQYAGRFDIFANNEFITKGRVEFNDYNDVMSLASSSNSVAIQNITGTSCPPNSCFIWLGLNDGGQIYHGRQAGLNPLLHAELPGYVAAIVNTTNDYNGSNYEFGDYNDVTAASRSLLYLRGTNQVVYYDRAASGHAGFKDLYQITTGTPTIASNTASWLTQSTTQKAYFTALLPAGATLSNAGLPSSTSYPQSSDWELVGNLEVAAGTPLSTQFLSVLEFGASTLTKSTTSLVSSSAGQAFDGSLVGSSLVMFMRSWPTTFTGVTYPASGATTQYISDLTPNTSYAISGAGAPTSATTDTAGVLTFSASGTGNITVGAGGVATTPGVVISGLFSGQVVIQ